MSVLIPIQMKNPVKRAKLKDKKLSALESKTQRVDSLANELGARREAWTKVQQNAI